MVVSVFNKNKYAYIFIQHLVLSIPTMKKATIY